MHRVKEKKMCRRHCVCVCVSRQRWKLRNVSPRFKKSFIFNSKNRNRYFVSQFGFGIFCFTFISISVDLILQFDCSRLCFFSSVCRVYRLSSNTTFTVSRSHGILSMPTPKTFEHSKLSDPVFNWKAKNKTYICAANSRVIGSSRSEFFFFSFFFFGVFEIVQLAWILFRSQQVGYNYCLEIGYTMQNSGLNAFIWYSWIRGIASEVWIPVGGGARYLVTFFSLSFFSLSLKIEKKGRSASQDSPPPISREWFNIHSSIQIGPVCTGEQLNRTREFNNLKINYHMVAASTFNRADAIEFVWCPAQHSCHAEHISSW